MYCSLISAIRNTISSGLSTQGTVVVWLLSDTSVVNSLAGAGGRVGRAEQGSCSVLQPGVQVLQRHREGCRGGCRLGSWLGAATAVELKYLLSVTTGMVPQHWHQRVNRVIAGTQRKLILVSAGFFLSLFFFTF